MKVHTRADELLLQLLVVCLYNIGTLDICMKKIYTKNLLTKCRRGYQISIAYCLFSFFVCSCFCVCVVFFYQHAGTD